MAFFLSDKLQHDRYGAPGQYSAVLPLEGHTYQTSDEWYTALAEMHIAQLAFQHNATVSSEDDCRNKYVSRTVFRRLAKQGHLYTFGLTDDEWSAQSS